MSEATPQKRVLPARERSESAAKRLASTPTTPATPASESRVKRKYTKRGSVAQAATPTTNSTRTATPVEEILPTKVQNSKPLPTTSQKQPEKLSNKEYQSVAESAVLAASLHRSRMQWLCDGVFRRYWTKPVKRKGVIEQPPGNPDAKTMSKLGNATMTVEPHVFDVTFYTVKDTTSVPPVYYRHPNQHTPKQASQPISLPRSIATPTPAPAPLTIPAVASVVSKDLTTPGASGSPTPAVPITKPGASATVKQEPGKTEIKGEATNAPTTVKALPVYPVAHLPTQSVAPASASIGSSRPTTDPVIQMLAARAATDNRLKDLMKVVATSQASSEQLREFQAHIDEFNKIIKQQDAKKSEDEKKKPITTATATPAATYKAPPRPTPGPGTSLGPMQTAAPTYPAYPPHRAEPFIKHIVVEFHSTPSATQGASTDRWLFPEYAVLDIKSGGMEMVASFFIIRKGEDMLKGQSSNEDVMNSLGQKFQPDVDYYQPMTVLIKATQHKTIETIARAAKPLVDCQSYMKEVIEKKTRAPQEHLVYRLPRDKVTGESSGVEFVDSAVELSNDEDDELKDIYILQA